MSSLPVQPAAGTATFNGKASITVWNKQGGLWFANASDGKKTTEQSLGGGNLVVR